MCGTFGGFQARRRLPGEQKAGGGENAVQDGSAAFRVSAIRVFSRPKGQKGGRKGRGIKNFNNFRKMGFQTAEFLLLY